MAAVQLMHLRGQGDGWQEAPREPTIQGSCHPGLEGLRHTLIQPRVALQRVAKVLARRDGDEGKLQMVKELEMVMKSAG